MKIVFLSLASILICVLILTRYRWRREAFTILCANTEENVEVTNEVNDANLGYFQTYVGEGYQTKFGQYLKSTKYKDTNHDYYSATTGNRATGPSISYDYQTPTDIMRVEEDTTLDQDHYWLIETANGTFTRTGVIVKNAYIQFQQGNPPESVERKKYRIKKDNQYVKIDTTNAITYGCPPSEFYTDYNLVLKEVTGKNPVIYYKDKQIADFVNNTAECNLCGLSIIDRNSVEIGITEEASPNLTCNATVQVTDNTPIKLLTDTQAKYNIVKAADRYMLKKKTDNDNDNTYLTFGNLTTFQKGYFQQDAALAASIHIEEPLPDHSFHLNLQPKPSGQQTYNADSRLKYQNGYFYLNRNYTTDASFQALDTYGNAAEPTFAPITYTDWRENYLPYAAIRKIGSTDNCVVYHASGYHMSDDEDDERVDLYTTCGVPNHWSQWIPECNADRRCRLHSRMVTNRCLDTEEIPNTNTSKLVGKPCDQSQFKWHIGDRNRLFPINTEATGINTQNLCLTQGSDSKLIVKKNQNCTQSDPIFTLDIEQKNDLNIPAVWNLSDKCMEGALEACDKIDGKYILPYEEVRCGDLQRFRNGELYEYDKQNNQCLYTGILELIRTQYMFQYDPRPWKTDPGVTWIHADQNCKGPWEFTYTFEVENDSGTVIDAFTTIPITAGEAWQQPTFKILDKQETLPRGITLKVYRTGKWPEYKELIKTYTSTSTVPTTIFDNEKTYCQLVSSRYDLRGTLSVEKVGRTYYAYQGSAPTHPIYLKELIPGQDPLRFDVFDYGDATYKDVFLKKQGEGTYVFLHSNASNLYLYSATSADGVDGINLQLEKISGLAVPERYWLYVRGLGATKLYLKVDANDNNKLIIDTREDTTMTKVVYTMTKVVS